MLDSLDGASLPRARCLNGTYGSKALSLRYSYLAIQYTKQWKTPLPELQEIQSARNAHAPEGAGRSFRLPAGVRGWLSRRH